MDLERLYQYTSTGTQTVTFKSLQRLLKRYQGKSLLTPAEANVLTYRIIETLMVENCDRDTLKVLARFLSKQAFDDLVEERVTNHYCGYPLCKFHDPAQIKKMQMNSLVVKLRMPRYYKSRFCCKRHYQCAEFYKEQLSPEALFMRTGISRPFFQDDTIESTIVLLEEYFEAKRNQSKMNLTAPAMNELMALMQKMEIVDEDEAESVRNRAVIANGGVNGGIAEDDSMADDVEIVENKGPHDSSDNYAHKDQS